MAIKQKYTCCICGLRSSECNNAEPVKNGNCCNTCNVFYVIPARIAILKQKAKAVKI